MRSVVAISAPDWDHGNHAADAQLLVISRSLDGQCSELH